MAKRDNNIDQTPIEFRIPRTLTGKGPRIPIPINQPHWIYKTTSNSKPNIFEWIGIGSFLIIIVTFSILFISQALYKSPLWIGVISFGALLILQIRSALIRTFAYTSEIEDDENNNSPKKREKKLPERRKDYK